jgi:tRNA(adenine34) deaminase
MNSYTKEQDEYFMGIALQLATQAFDSDEVPVGAIVVCKNRIIGKGYNQTIALNDPTAHAEMLAMTSAFGYLGSRYLKDCSLYVTLEPCPMCAGASYWGQLSRLVFGASDKKRGYEKFSSQILHPHTQVVRGVLEGACEIILEEFFKKIR